MKIKETACKIVDELLETESEFTTVDQVDRKFLAAGLTQALDMLSARDTLVMLGYCVVGHYVYKPV